MTAVTGPDAPLNRLLSAYAAKDLAVRDRLVRAFDERLAGVVRSTTQPMIGQMRIAWWDEVLGDPAGVRGHGDPLVDALRAGGIAGEPGLRAMLDGWEALLADPVDEAALAQFAAGRGGGLFRALAAEADAPDWLAAAGRVWALWDLAGHLPAGDPLAGRALDLAGHWLPEMAAARWPGRWKPMALAAELARRDVRRGIVPLAGLTPALYARLLRIALLGR